MQPIERDPRAAPGLEFDFKAPERSGRVVFELLGARVQVGEPPLELLANAELWLERGEHVSLVGPNGSGKSTLIETLLGRRALADGALSTGHNVTLGYLSQHSDELSEGAQPGQTVLEATQRATGLTPNKARALLGRFLFSGEEADKPLAGLSGGERRRLSLAILVQSARERADPRRADQPSRHREPRGARGCSGRVLRRSPARLPRSRPARRRRHAHDCDRGPRPAQLSRRLARVRSGARSPRRGRRRGPRRRRARAGRCRAARERGIRAAGDADAVRARGGRNHREEPSKNRLAAQAKAERAIEDAEAALRALEDELADPAAWATRYEAAKSEARHTAARRAVEEAYARLETLID